MLSALLSVSLGALTEADPLTLPNIRLLGRMGKDAVNLYWSGSGVELDLYGTELWVELDVDWSWGEPWLVALENDRLLYRMPLQKGKQWVLVFRGFDRQRSHHIKVLRETQGLVDQVTSIKLTKIRYDGELKKLPDPKAKIEFVGDSYTSGECALGQKDLDTEWIPPFCSAAVCWPRQAAQELGADYRIVAMSGWGTVTGHDNYPDHALPKIYEYIAGQVSSGKGSNMNRNDFKAWQPDIVVIALGTNDKTAWSKEALGTSKNTPEKFENAAYSFLVLVRQLNPNAYIAWQFFENDAQVVPILERVVAKFKKDNDQRCSLLLIPPWTMDGCNWHPGVIDHTAAGKKMAQKIAAILGLK